MNIFLRLGNLLWFLDFENPSINKDFMAFQKNLVKSAKAISYLAGTIKINNLIFLKSHTIFICRRIFKIQKPQQIGKPQE